MNQLSRVQVYLDPKNLSVIDNVAMGVKVSRSLIIRDAVAAATNSYARAFRLLRGTVKAKRNPLLDLIGIEKSKTGTVGLNVDEIYQND